MKHGRLFLGAIGMSLVIVGVVAVFLSTPIAVIGLVLLIGLGAIVLAVSDWTEFEAEIRDVKFKISKQVPPAPAPPERKPELKILSLEERGGGDREVDFAAEVVNTGMRYCRAEVTASVGEAPVAVQPSTLDLLPDQTPQRVRVFVPRPALGDLVHAFNHATTLYGRTLTLVVSCGDNQVAHSWREHVYSPEENSERAAIQQRVWRIGLGEATEADCTAEAQSDLLRRHDERWSDDA